MEEKNIPLFYKSKEKNSLARGFFSILRIEAMRSVKGELVTYRQKMLTCTKQSPELLSPYARQLAYCSEGPSVEDHYNGAFGLYSSSPSNNMRGPSPKAVLQLQYLYALNSVSKLMIPVRKLRL